MTEKDKEEDVFDLENNSEVNTTFPPHHNNKIDLGTGLNPVYAFLLMAVGAMSCAVISYFLTVKYVLSADDVSCGSASGSQHDSDSVHSLELGGMKPQTVSFSGQNPVENEQYLDYF